MGNTYLQQHTIGFTANVLIALFSPQGIAHCQRLSVPSQTRAWK